MTLYTGTTENVFCLSTFLTRNVLVYSYSLGYSVTICQWRMTEFVSVFATTGWQLNIIIMISIL